MWSEEKKIHSKNIYAANSGAYIDTGVVPIFYVGIQRDSQESGTKCNIS